MNEKIKKRKEKVISKVGRIVYKVNVKKDGKENEAEGGWNSERRRRSSACVSPSSLYGVENARKIIMRRVDNCASGISNILSAYVSSLHLRTRVIPEDELIGERDKGGIYSLTFIRFRTFLLSHIACPYSIRRARTTNHCKRKKRIKKKKIERNISNKHNTV